ncbi:MAG: YbjN domain-containing protein [Bacteroidetes bacterium]|nr:YbjN domain-containing protein [Bacteroidota bacterium]
MFTRIVKYFDKKGWKYQLESEMTRVVFGIQANHANIDCIADVRNENNQFIFLSICNCSAFPDKYDDIVEFITRANYGLINGSFEFDFKNGVTRFKTTVLYEDAKNISDAILDKYIITNLFTMDLYIPGIMSIIYGDNTAYKAIQEIEGVKGLNFN